MSLLCCWNLTKRTKGHTKVLIALTVGGWCTLLRRQDSAQENRSAGVCNTLVHTCVLGEQEKEHFICHSKTHRFSSLWYLCVQKSPCMLHPISQRLPQCCLWNGSNICLIHNGPIVKHITHWVVRHKHGNYIIGWGCAPVWTISWWGSFRTANTAWWLWNRVPSDLITRDSIFHRCVWLVVVQPQTSEMQLFMCWAKASKRYE